VTSDEHEEGAVFVVFSSVRIRRRRRRRRRWRKKIYSRKS